jgi:broad specificity phosphatase PhoE
MHIYLIRHGETDWNTKFLYQGHTDIALNKTGIKQAEYIAKELKTRHIKAVISSDLKRAYKTAEIIKRAAGIKAAITKDRRLRERDYGDLEGQLYERFKRRTKKFTGENDGKFFARVNVAFRAVVNKYRDKDVAIVTHGGVVRQIVSHVLGLKQYKRLRIYNASISEIFYDSKKKAFFLLLLNSVSHLPEGERNKIEYHIKGV